MHDSGMDHEIVVEELGGSGEVGHNPAHGASDEVDVLGSVGAEPVVDGSLISKVELVTSSRKDVREPGRGEPAGDRRADEAGVPGDEDSRFL